MRFINFIVLFLLVPGFASANWVSETDFAAAKSGASGGGVHRLQKSCLSKNQGEKCFNISGKDIRKWMIGSVDDTTKPNFRAAENSPVKIDCQDFKDCRLKALDPNGDLKFDDRVCLADQSSEKWDELSNWPSVTGLNGPWFIWCQKRDGTFKKKDVLVNDPAGKAQAEAEDAANAAERVSKITKRNARLNALVTCAKTKIADFTAATQKNCLRALAREIVRNKLKAAEQ